MMNTWNLEVCNMVCPYAVDRNIVIQINREYDEEGTEIKFIQAEKNSAKFLKCQQADCGAWYNGRCQYRG